jgi:hypothetical protein
MREGAWINAHTGAWSWISEHASWIQRPENAQALGLPVKDYARLATIPWDFNGPGREAILREAMDAGFIRMRGHGAEVTFEFTLPMTTAIRALAPFMTEHCGPLTGCRFNDLKRETSLGIAHGALQLLLEGREESDLAALVGSASILPGPGRGLRGLRDSTFP